jgi:hypothetical protein
LTSPPQLEKASAATGPLPPLIIWRHGCARTATLNTIPTLRQAHAATVDGNAYPGIRTHHDTIAAWAVDLDDVRISASGPATVLNQLDIELRTTN